MPEQNEGAGTEGSGTPATEGRGGFEGIQVPPATQGNASEKVEGNEAGGKPSEEPPRLWAGRYKTPEEMEQGLLESSEEGRRLYKESREYRSRVDELMSQLEEAKSAGSKPRFTALSDEEVKSLKEDNPAQYAEYILAKDRFDRDEAASAEKRAAAQRAEQEESARVEKSIRDKLMAMRSNPENYPDFHRLLPVQMKLRDLCPGIEGREWAPDILYYAALGYAHKASLKGAANEEGQSRADAGAQARAAAGKTGAGLPSGGGAPKKELDELNARIAEGAGKAILPTFG